MDDRKRSGAQIAVELTNYSTLDILVLVELSFGKALRELRRTAGLSQRQLADRSGLDFSYISKLENDRLPPPAADTVVTLAAILGRPAEELLGLTGKLPSNVQQAVGKSSSAQRFLLEAQRMGLSDTEWKRMAARLKTLRRAK